MEDLKKSVHSVLLTFKFGATEREFKSGYEACTGSKFSEKNCGYVNFHAFVMNNAEYFTIARSQTGEFVYKAKVTESTRALQEFIKYQKNPPKKNIKRVSTTPLNTRLRYLALSPGQCGKGAKSQKNATFLGGSNVSLARNNSVTSKPKKFTVTYPPYLKKSLASNALETLRNSAAVQMLSFAQKPTTVMKLNTVQKPTTVMKLNTVQKPTTVMKLNTVQKPDTIQQPTTVHMQLTEKSQETVRIWPTAKSDPTPVLKHTVVVSSAQVVDAAPKALIKKSLANGVKKCVKLVTALEEGLVLMFGEDHFAFEDQAGMVMAMFDFYKSENAVEQDWQPTSAEPIAFWYKHTWLRASVVNQLQGDSFLVFCVDFGYLHVASKMNMRKLHKDFTNFPQKTFLAHFEDLPCKCVTAIHRQLFQRWIEKNSQTWTIEMPEEFCSSYYGAKLTNVAPYRLDETSEKQIFLKDFVVAKLIELSNIDDVQEPLENIVKEFFLRAATLLESINGLVPNAA